jgi:hypothetical protein
MQASYSRYYEPRKKLMFALLVCSACVFTTMKVKASLKSLDDMAGNLEETMAEVSGVFKQTADALAKVEGLLGRRELRAAPEGESNLDPLECCSFGASGVTLTCCTDFAVDASSMMESYGKASEQFCSISLHMLAKLAGVIQANLGLQIDGLLDTTKAFAMSQSVSVEYAIVKATESVQELGDIASEALDDGTDLEDKVKEILAGAVGAEQEGSYTAAEQVERNTKLLEELKDTVGATGAVSKDLNDSNSDADSPAESADEKLAEALQALARNDRDRRRLQDVLAVTGGANVLNSMVLDSPDVQTKDLGTVVGTIDLPSELDNMGLDTSSLNKLGNSAKAAAVDSAASELDDSSIDTAVRTTDSTASMLQSKGSALHAKGVDLFSGADDAATELLELAVAAINGPVKDQIVNAVQITNEALLHVSLFVSKMQKMVGGSSDKVKEGAEYVGADHVFAQLTQQMNAFIEIARRQSPTLQEKMNFFPPEFEHPTIVSIVPVDATIAPIDGVAADGGGGGDGDGDDGGSDGAGAGNERRELRARQLAQRQKAKHRNQRHRAQQEERWRENALLLARVDASTSSASSEAFGLSRRALLDAMEQAQDHRDKHSSASTDASAAREAMEFLAHQFRSLSKQCR